MLHNWLHRVWHIFRHYHLPTPPPPHPAPPTTPTSQLLPRVVTNECIIWLVCASPTSYMCEFLACSLCHSKKRKRKEEAKAQQLHHPIRFLSGAFPRLSLNKRGWGGGGGVLMFALALHSFSSYLDRKVKKVEREGSQHGNIIASAL